MDVLFLCLSCPLQEAVHALVMGKFAFSEDSALADYHYPGVWGWREVGVHECGDGGKWVCMSVGMGYGV